MSEQQEHKKLDIETIGFGIQARRQRTGMLSFFDITEARELQAWLNEHQTELDALYKAWQQQERKRQS